MNTPLVTIVVPTYQGEKSLPLLLDSFKSAITSVYERYFEIIVVVDGSTDKSIKVLERYNSSLSITILNKSNGGAASARNLGIDHANTQFIWMIDDDMVVNETAVKAVVNFYSKAVEVKTLVSGPCWIPENDKSMGENIDWHNSLYENLNRTGKIEDIMDCHFANTCASKEFLIDTGLFSTEFRQYGGEDNEFSVRLLKNDAQWLFIGDMGIHHIRDKKPLQELSEIRQSGASRVLLTKLHPELFETIFFQNRAGRIEKIVDRLPVNKKLVYTGIYYLSIAILYLKPMLPGRIVRSVERIGMIAAEIVGLYDADASEEMVRRVEGIPR